MTDDMSHPSSLSVGFVSLGCAKNLVDSQLMAGVLISEGITLAPRPEAADVVLVNTCAFIDEAREESMDAILSACRLKQDGSCKAVIVAGCLPQRYRQGLRQRLPDVDAFIGLDELDKIAVVARRIVAGERNVWEVSGHASRLFEPRVPGLVFAGGPYAYLKIAEGCHHRCAFCAIPGIRGDYRSRSPERIVREAECLLENGFRELNLISQDTTRYGRDLHAETGGPGPNLPGLIRALGRIGGKFWIRLLYGHPSGLTDELLAAMAETAQVCRYLDIPFQHSDPAILRAMGRADTIASVQTLPRRLRQIMPDIALRTTCLVGFPGEEEEHFQRLLDFVAEAAFDHLGVFVFSPEEGTRAADMPGRPSRETAEERRQRLLAAQKKIVDGKAAALIGKEAEVLLETSGRSVNNVPASRSKSRRDVRAGRSARQAPEADGRTWVEKAPADRKPGDFVRVRYTASDDYDMVAVFSAAD